MATANIHNPLGRSLARMFFLAGCAAALALPQAAWLREHRGDSAARNPYDQSCQEINSLPQGDAQGAFRDISGEVGIEFQHLAGPPGSFFLPEINGVGGALFDYDSDDDLDILLVNAGRSPHAQGEFPPQVRSGNGLFRQNHDGTFTDVAVEAGIADTGYSVGCAVGDIDNDGDPDLYVTCYGPDKLLENRQGKFVDITAQAGIVEDGYSTSAAFVDFDRDGWLDLYVAHYISDPLHGHSAACDFGEGRLSYCGPLRFTRESDQLFRNLGPGKSKNVDDGDANGVRFADVSETAGIRAASGAAFTIVVSDFSRDGWPDIYVAHDMYANRLWINRTDGSFADEATIRGAATDGAGVIGGSMGVAAGDANGDGAIDLVVTKFSHEGATFYRGGEDGLFTDISRESQVLQATRPHTGWGAVLVDLDHDGDLDLPIANGLVTPCQWIRPSDRRAPLVVVRGAVADPAAFWADYADRNLLFQNTGDGVFADVSGAGGDFTHRMGSARCLAFGDIDNDGDLDLLATYIGGAARLYRNEIRKSGRWLMVRAIDPALRRDAYGAEVVVVAGGRRFRRDVHPSSGYLASNDARAHFGLGFVDRYDSIEIRWPDGLLETFPGGEPDRRVLLRRGEGAPSAGPTP